MGMNYEYMGVEDAIIDEKFQMPDEMIATFCSAVNNDLQSFCKPVDYKEDGNYEYRKIRFGDASALAYGKIQGVYQNGVVFELLNDSNDIMDRVTTAYCVIVKDETPVFVVSGIDGRYEPNRAFGSKNNSSVKIEVNNDVLRNLGSRLGQRIDNNYVGPRKKANFFNKNRLQKEETLMDEKIKLLVASSLEQFGSPSRART